MVDRPTATQLPPQPVLPANWFWLPYGLLPGEENATPEAVVLGLWRTLPVTNALQGALVNLAGRTGLGLEPLAEAVETLQEGRYLTDEPRPTVTLTGDRVLAYALPCSVVALRDLGLSVTLAASVRRFLPWLVPEKARRLTGYSPDALAGWQRDFALWADGRVFRWPLAKTGDDYRAGLQYVAEAALLYLAELEPEPERELAWRPVYRQLAWDRTGDEASWQRQDGKTRAGYGRLTGLLGRATGDDVRLSLLWWRLYFVSTEYGRYLPTQDGHLLSSLRAWLRKNARQLRAGTYSPARKGEVLQLPPLSPSNGGVDRKLPAEGGKVSQQQNVAGGYEEPEEPAAPPSTRKPGWVVRDGQPTRSRRRKGSFVVKREEESE